MTETHQRLILRVVPQGPLLLGGWSGDSTADVASARRATVQGERFFVPGSALRGAMRLAFEQVLRGAGLPACAPSGAPGAGGACDCRVCRLFGKVGQSGLVQIGAAELAAESRGELQPMLRYGVALDRYTGSVAEHRLFQQRVAMPVGDVELHAELSFTRRPTAAELEDLRLAASLVESIGRGSGRGLGRVQVDVAEGRRPAAARPVGGEDPSALVLWLEPLAPFHVGNGRSRPFFLATEGYVPGAAVRGAIGTSLAVAGEEGAPEFRRLLGLDGQVGASFGDALPCRPGQATIRPRSAVRCRGCRKTSHAPLWEAMVGSEAGVASGVLFPKHGRCLHCGERTAPVEPLLSLPRRLWTRVAIDRHTAAAADQRLHAMEVVDPAAMEAAAGSVGLRCEVRGLDASSAALLARLHGLELQIGHGRGVGLGRMRVRCEPAPQDVDVEERRRRIDGKLAALRAPRSSSSGGWTILMATGPWTRECGGEHPLVGSPEARWERCYPVRGVVSGFDLLLQKERQRRWAWLPGTVFVYRHDVAPAASWLRDLVAVGQRGSGPGACRGEGRFEVNPSVFLQEVES